MSDDFWAKKLAKEQGQTNPVPVSAPVRLQDRPWWDNSPVPTPNPTPVDSNPQDRLEGHDVSKAQHIKGEGNCPECGSDGYFSPTGNTVRRCYFCGYLDGRDVRSVGVIGGAISSGTTRSARQTDSGGRIVNNYHQIQSANEAVARVS